MNIIASSRGKEVRYAEYLLKKLYVDGVLILTVGGREGQMSLISGGLLLVGRVIVMLHGRADSIYSRCECVTSSEAPFLRPCNGSSLGAVCGAVMLP